MTWYRKAAEQGHAGAQYNLGVMYATGKGLPEDYVLAYMFLSLAAGQGNSQATQAKDGLVPKMTPSQRAEAEQLTREWKPKKQN
jgi:TPR repeat protein